MLSPHERIKKTSSDNPYGHLAILRNLPIKVMFAGLLAVLGGTVYAMGNLLGQAENSTKCCAE